jgi:hypothetical protein
MFTVRKSIKYTRYICKISRCYVRILKTTGLLKVTEIRRLRLWVDVAN